MKKHLVAMVIVVAALMLFSPMFGLWSSTNAYNASTATQAGSTGSGSSPVTSAVTPWTPGTPTMQEPGFTYGNYTVATVNNIGHMNIYQESSLYAFLMTGEIYGSAVATLPNDTFSPWLATGWSEQNVTGNSYTTFDPMTQQQVAYNYTWIVHIRPGVQWTDYNSTNAASTYVYSNHTVVRNGTGAATSYTYKSFKSTTMRSEYVQASDFIQSWEIMSQSQDFSGSYANVVNVIPLSNLTVEYMLSAQSATFLTYTLQTIVLPYHIWHSHDFANTPGDWNYSASGASGMGYDTWELGWNPTTGFAPYLIGTGPFEMSGYGMPHGYYINNKGYQLYVNPHFWAQYANVSSHLRQYTPKIYSQTYAYYSTLSNAVTAMSQGKAQTIVEGVDPSFVPIVNSMPSTYIYHKPSSGYGFMQLNSFPSNAPMNITAFRQALQYATNKQYLASVVDSGYDILGTPLIPPSDPLWRNTSTPSYTYNPAKAAALIASIPGMKNNTNGPGTGWTYFGKPVTADIQITSAGPNPLGVEGALLIAQWWGAIGVKTTVTQEAFTTLIPNLVLYNYNVISLGITGISGDPTGDYFAFYNYDQGMGTGFYLGPWSSMTYNGKFYTGAQVNSTMNNLTNKLNEITNLSERIQISDEIQGIAAIQGTMINLGYGVDILPFTNSTFVNISRVNTLPYAAYMYWAMNTVHVRSGAVSTQQYTSHLEVSVAANQTTYYNGQPGYVTITVKNNVTGAAVQGASVTLAATPAGATLNTTSLAGKTNANGQYVVDFNVLNTQTQIYTQGYGGNINFTASASSSSSTVKSGIGYVNVNVLPKGMKLVTSPTPLLLKGGSKQLYWVKVETTSGSPISGFQYTLQTMSGAVLMSPAMKGETETNTSTANPFFGAYYSVNNTATPGFTSLAVNSISGVTSSNGTIYVWLQANATYNFNAQGNPAQSYVFFGSISQGTPVTGAAGYMIPGEMTSVYNANGNGFGLQQPVEFPVQLATSTPSVKVTLSVSSDTMGYNGYVVATVKVTNSTGAPVSGYKVDLTSQNVFGANRGFFTSDFGTDILASNPNSVFGSTILPGMQLTTNATGVATAEFLPYYYSYNTTSQQISQLPFPTGPTALVPVDQFILTASGANTASAMPVSSLLVTSNSRAESYYNVTFTEKDLTAGTTWYVNLSNGVSLSTTSSSITASFVNGTYTYLYASANPNFKGSSGTFTVNGATQTVTAQFTEYFQVSFNETGLPSGTTWYVNLTNGQSYKSTSSVINFMEDNGTYHYTVASTAAGYTVSNSTGNLTVSGSADHVSVAFTAPPTKTTSSGLSTLDYAIIGVVVAVIVIVGVVAVVRTRGKNKP